MVPRSGSSITLWESALSETVLAAPIAEPRGRRIWIWQVATAEPKLTISTLERPVAVRARPYRYAVALVEKRFSSVRTGSAHG
jgi:hypothetical protein